MSMKKLFTVACSVAMLHIFLPLQAQMQDTTLARVDESKNISSAGKMGTEATESVPMQVDELPSNVAPNSKFILPSEIDKNSKDWLLEIKVGPNGEDLLQEDDAYYYINGNGEKTKVDISQLKDKAKHS